MLARVDRTLGQDALQENLGDQSEDNRQPSEDSEGAIEPPLTIRFIPLRRAGRRRRALLWLIGPVLWAALIVTVALVVHHFYSVELALLVMAATFLGAVLVLGPVGWRRHRRLSP